MDDVRAVMDAAGSERAVLFGYSEGGRWRSSSPPPFPSGRGRSSCTAPSPNGSTPTPTTRGRRPREERARVHRARWSATGASRRDMRSMCPSADDAMARWWGERCRAAASPGAVRALMEMNSRIDVRDAAAGDPRPDARRAPRHRLRVRVEEGRYIAERIPGARLVELPGADHFVGVDPDQILDVVEPFLAECGGGPGPATTIGRWSRWSPPRSARPRRSSAPRPSLARYRGRRDRGRRRPDRWPVRRPRSSRPLCGRDHGRGARSAPRSPGVHTGEVELADGRVRGAPRRRGSHRGRSRARRGAGVKTVTDIVAGSGLEFADRETSRRLAPLRTALLAVVVPTGGAGEVVTGPASRGARSS